MASRETKENMRSFTTCLKDGIGFSTVKHRSPFQEEICLCPRADVDYVTNIYVRENVQSWLFSGQVEVGQVSLQ